MTAPDRRRDGLREAISRLAVGDPEWPLDRVLALAEAAPPSPGLDVERLSMALIQTGLYIDEDLPAPIDLARDLAAEYARRTLHAFA